MKASLSHFIPAFLAILAMSLPVVSPAQVLLDFNDDSAWNGGTGFTYSANDMVPFPFDHVNILPYAAQSGSFTGFGVDLTYEHAIGFTQGVIVNDYESATTGSGPSNMPELNTYAAKNGGLIRTASDNELDSFGDNDGYATLTFDFDTDVLLSDLVIGSIDSRYQWRSNDDQFLFRDHIRVRAYDGKGNLVDPSAQNLNPFGVAAGPVNALDAGTSGWEFSPADAAQPADPNGGPMTINFSIHAVELDYATNPIRRLELEAYGDFLDLGTRVTTDPYAGTGFSFGVAGFKVTPIPEPAATFLCGVAVIGMTLRRRR